MLRVEILALRIPGVAVRGGSAGIMFTLGFAKAVFGVCTRIGTFQHFTDFFVGSADDFRLEMLCLIHFYFTGSTSFRILIVSKKFERFVSYIQPYCVITHIP